MPTTTTDALDGLLLIRDGFETARWNFPAAVGSPPGAPAGIGQAVQLSYSFPLTRPAHSTETGFLAFSAAQAQTTRDILAGIEAVVGIDFVEAAPGQGQISFGASSQPAGQGGYAYAPSYDYRFTSSAILSVQEHPEAGDVWINRNTASFGQPWTPHSAGHANLLHEIGHALGLKHPFQARSAQGFVLDPALDHEGYTVMAYQPAPRATLVSVSGSAASYTWTSFALRPSTLMLLDIEALQHLYGANTRSREGNDVYRWDLNPEILLTLWDTGGIDTLDASNQTLPNRIDLQDGRFSSISLRLSDADRRLGLDLPSWYTQALPADVYDGSHNVAIAKGTVIEHAKGGSAADWLGGNAAANALSGGAGADTLIGGAGHDTLNGGSGIDRLEGGSGHDLYLLDSLSDVVVEAAGGGTDTIQTHLSYSLNTAALAQVEHLSLTNVGSVNATGNALNNVLTGNAGNNTLDGLGGSDTASYAAATVKVTVSLALTGAQATGAGSDTLLNIEHLTGGSAGDSLTGNAGANILNGGAGIDTLTGGLGNDTYVIDSSSDLIVEAAGGGTDTVQTHLSYSLNTAARAQVEHLTLTGSASVNATGNALDNILSGNAGNNILDGLGGSDTASYAASTVAVSVSLALAGAQATGAGSDTLLNIEHLTGGSASDRLTGNAGANLLTGGAGSDTLSGGAGADRFVLNSGSGSDRVTDFLSGTDKVQLSMAALRIGNGNTVVDGAVVDANGPGGFAATAELVVAQQNIVGAISASSAAAVIGSATTAYAVGASRVFVVDNGVDSAVYRFVAADANAGVAAGELRLLATLAGTAALGVGDVVFGG